jgi:hypothetical protein
MSIEKLFNSGIKPIGDLAALYGPEKTLIVVGPARGGTSLVAGALDHLGVFTGDRSSAPVFEDVRLADACEQGGDGDVRKIVSEYDSNHDVWAYKRPGIIEDFSVLDGVVRNPIYLFIFKDVFSIANRNNISVSLDIVNGLERALDGYSKMAEFIKRSRPNGILLSYDRVMQNKERFVDLMIEVVGSSRVSESQRSGALNFIEPNPVAYVNASRTTLAVGQASVTPLEVTGTAHYVHAPNKEVVVEVLVNGELAGTAKGSDAGPGPRSFAFAFDRELAPGDVVDLQLSEDVVPFASGLKVSGHSRAGD